MQLHEHPTDPQLNYWCIGGPEVCIVHRARALLDEMCELDLDSQRIMEIVNAEHEASHDVEIY